MTQHYVGTKIVMAWEQDKDGQPGYSVKYNDGYISWSPKAQFEEANVELGHIGHLPPHQQRVVAELGQLADRTEKLEAFTETPLFASLAEDDQKLLTMQLDAMHLYADILNKRTDKFQFGGVK